MRDTESFAHRRGSILRAAQLRTRTPRGTEQSKPSVNAVFPDGNPSLTFAVKNGSYVFTKRNEYILFSRPLKSPFWYDQ
jgi:hypothetical protein